MNMPSGELAREPGPEHRLFWSRCKDKMEWNHSTKHTNKFLKIDDSRRVGFGIEK